jgi:hypothetical protein
MVSSNAIKGSSGSTFFQSVIICGKNLSDKSADNFDER